MTLAQSRQFQTGLAGAAAVHLVLLFLLALLLSVDSAGWRSRYQRKAAPGKEPETVQIFPLLPIPKPVPKPEPNTYIRTTQNAPDAAAPKRAAFMSDRNTHAASDKAPSPDGKVPLPSMAGIDRPTLELANRDYRDGEIKDDAVPKALPVPQMHSPSHSEPSPPASAPAPAAAQNQEKPREPQKPVQIAKQESETPLSKMIEEMDREAVRLEVNRLPLEIRKPGEPPPANTPPKPPAPAQPPAKSIADDPPAPKAVPIPKTPATSAGKPAKDAFTPFTRTAAVKGTISNRGSNAVDAESTPLGIYMRSVTGAVEQKWHRYRLVKKDAVTYGSLKVRFYVAKDGKPEDLRIISDPRNADPRMADFTLRAIQDAEIPPIPEDLLPMLNEERVMIEYDVLIY